MNKSKKHSDNSTKPTKREQEPENPNLDVERQTLPQILKMLTLKQWVATLSVIITIIAIIFKAGVEYHKAVMSKDEEIQRLNYEIGKLEKKTDTLSDERSRLEKDKQRLNKNIDSQMQKYNTLKQDLQKANNEHKNMMEEIKRLNFIIDSLSRVPPENLDTTSYEVTIDLYGFEFQTTNFSIFLNDSLKAQGSQNSFELSEPEGVYNLKIQYNDNANRKWEYSDIITFNALTSTISIQKSEFVKLRH